MGCLTRYRHPYSFFTLSFMQGAIAAGSRHTAEAGARVLEEGGNAVDACIAAAFAAAVAEGPLTGPTGGGFFLGWVEGEVTLLDCLLRRAHAPPRRDRGPHGRLRRLDAELPRRRGLGRRARARRRPRGGASPLRERAVAAARRARDRARGAGSRRDRGAALPPPDPHRHPAARRRRTADLRRRRSGSRRSDFVATLERVRDAPLAGGRRADPRARRRHREATRSPSRSRSAPASTGSRS